MRAFQLGLIVAVALGALLWSALWVMAQPAPPDATPAVDSATTVEASAVDVVGLQITATVGTEPNTCATTNTVQVRSGTTVYYCFTLHHTGVTSDDPLTQHHLQTSRGVNQNLTESLTLAPGEVTDKFDNDKLIVFTETIAVDISNFVTWTARPADSDPVVTASSRVTVDIVGPALSVLKTVGQDRDSCGASSSIRIPSGQTAFFCITVQNQGDVTFTNHSLVDTPMGINSTFNYTLAPGASLSILPTNLATLGIGGRLDQSNVTGNFANTASYTARASVGSELTASGVSTATVGVGNTTVRFTKTLSTDAEACNGSRTITVSPGTRVYYCALIENTGAVTLTQHQLTESWLSLDVKFDYPLRPGEVLRVTNDFLARHNQPIVFGPFEVHPRFGNNIVNSQMRYLGSSPEGFEVSAGDTTTASYPPAPTHTPTSRPDNTSTFTPVATNTSTNTPVPLTPTFTPTPTDTPVTPSPTPTRSYAISLLQTPTPRAQAANFPQGSPQQDAALTATAVSLQQPSQFPEGQQPPVQEPALATATQIAVDATAAVATATASQLAIDSVAATAIAQSQAPLPGSSPFDSPVATPTIGPDFPQEGDQSGLPVAPVPETTGSVPVESANATPIPGDGTVTVMPPIVTVVVATETPVVALLVVTNTPDPAAALLPGGQRPIVYPTPTPTADYVMAAARTFDVAVTTLGWLWFLVGSLVFFVTAGVVAGLFFRQSEANRYELPEPDYWLEEEPQADRPRRSPASGQSADDDWPADLP
ncbi:MAG: hypothetical protein IT328_11975 [Caldilineaceae bacterium]|nr:hypothetical protein [Caldilineaceae bacterium]